MTTSIDEGIDYLRNQVMPALMRINGCVGLSLLVDRDSGRCIATSAWDAESTMRGSRSAVEAVRDEATAAFGGTMGEIQEWEIAVLHREHSTRPGTGVRVSWIKGAPDTVDRAVEHLRDVVLPEVERLPGFCSASVLVDRGSGRMAAAFAYDSREALEQSRSAAKKIRTTTVSELGAELEDVREFELALAHLRVPELV